MSAMPKPRDLRFTPPAPVPRERGRTMRPADVARETFEGFRSAKWIRENAPARYRGWFGNKLVFREADMREWKDSLFGQDEP